MAKAKVKIKTISKVIPMISSEFEIGLKYGVPYDTLGLPYFPIFHFISNEFITKITHARLEGYNSLVAGIISVKDKLKLKPKQVLSLFTDICDIKGTSEKARAIKEGVTFVFELETDDKESLNNYFKSIHNLGYINDEITGEVEIDVQWDVSDSLCKKKAGLSERTTFSRIDYRFELVSPLCVFTPSQSNDTKNYVPGELIFNMIKRELKDKFYGFDDGEFICTNAYPAYNGRRTIPAPIAFVCEKLDRSQVQYKLATQPDYLKQVQTVKMNNDFLIDIENSTVKRLSVDIEGIPVLLSFDNENSSDDTFNAIRTGYVFAGSIYGSDSQIRQIYDLLNYEKSYFLGTFTDKGYGEVQLSYIQAKEKRIEPESYYKMFDLFVNSDLKLYNSNGLYTSDTDVLLKKIEELLGEQGNLEFVSSHSDSSIIYGNLDNINEEICISKGSAFRIRKRDGSMINVSPIIRKFIGEDTKFGYGEIRTYPPYNQYYRYSDDVRADRAENSRNQDIKDIRISIDIINRILRQEVYDRVKKIALIDKINNTLLDDEEILDVLRTINHYMGGNYQDERLLEIYKEGN